MYQIKGLVVAAAVSLLTVSAGHAANYQDGKTKNCTAANSCSVTFKNAGLGKTLRMTNLSCKVLTSAAAPAFVTQFFDGKQALFIPTYVQDLDHRSFVASASGNVMFFTGGAEMKVTALHGGSLDSQLACTLTGITN